MSKFADEILGDWMNNHLFFVYLYWAKFNITEWLFNI